MLQAARQRADRSRRRGGLGAAALATLRRILARPAAAGDGKLRGDLLNDLALALMMTGELTAARRMLDEEPPAGAGLSVDLERALLRGLLALACGAAPAAAVIAADVAARAASAGWRIRLRAAERLADAVRNPPPPHAFPWMLWVLEYR